MNRFFKCAVMTGNFILSNVCIANAESNVTCSSIVYGKSEMGRDLICYSISEEDYDRTILLNFAIHGFEDE